MDIEVPPGWDVVSNSTYGFLAAHSRKSLETDISPIYKQSRKQQTEPSAFRVQIKTDWFSREVLGDVEQSEKVDTLDEAVRLASSYMSDHADEDATVTYSSSASGRDAAGSVTTGSQTLDEMLDGGIPKNRSVLLTGTPGTGKSTLSMQFLQAGLEAGDKCLYISSEQVQDEIRSSFSEFDFDLSHDDLAISTIHAVADGHGTAGSLEGDEEGSDQRGSFDREGVLDYLRMAREADRIVLDSVSGLRPMAEDDATYRRAVLDIIRLFNDEMDATAIMTAESFGAARGDFRVESVDIRDAVQYNLHGVIRLWRERVSGGFRRFVDVMKMRGVDHDSRAFEVTFDDGGLHVVPRENPVSGPNVDRNLIATGIDEIDSLLGGGIECGGGILLEYDEQSNIEPLLMSVVSSAVDEMRSVVFMPSANMNPQRLSGLLDEIGSDMEAMLEGDQLFIVDAYGSWDAKASENVFLVNDETADIRESYEEITGRAAGRGTAFVVDTLALIDHLGPESARQFRSWQEAQVLQSNDMLMDISNPDLLDPRVESFFANSARQIVETWVNEGGHQYLKIRKGTGAEIGSVRHMRFTDTKPFVDIC